MNSEAEAKYYRDKHVIERLGEVRVKGETFNNLPLLGISEENYRRFIKEKQTDKEKKEEILLNFLKLIGGKNPEWSKGTEILVEYVKSKLRIYTTKNDVKTEMWVYKEGVYLPQGKSEVKMILRDVLKEWYSQYIVNLVIAKIEADTFIETATFFIIQNRKEVCVLNGILNIETNELTPFTPDKIFFNKMPVKYEPKAECKMIDAFLEEVLANKEDVKVFYELGGFALLKEYRYEKAFMFVGNGRNGKGKTIDLLRRVFGSSNCCSIPLSNLLPDSFQISELYGKSLNLAGDIDNKDLRDTSMFKSATGRDLLNGKRKFLPDISFENYAKFVFACNDLPMVYDLSKGFWDRWILLEFPFYFAEKERFEQTQEQERINWKIRDTSILDKITTEQELSGLLNKFLEGLKRLKKNEKFSQTIGTEQTKNLWIRKANSFIAFVMDEIEEDYDGKISKKEVRKKYAEYCKLHKVLGKSDAVIKRVLQENFGASEDRIQQSLNYDKYTQDWYWTGIKWKSKNG